jgi:hypothetical protein
MLLDETIYTKYCLSIYTRSCFQTAADQVVLSPVPVLVIIIPVL